MGNNKMNRYSVSGAVSGAKGYKRKEGRAIGIKVHHHRGMIYEFMTNHPWWWGLRTCLDRTFLTLLYLIMTHWFSQSISIFRYMLSVRA